MYRILLLFSIFLLCVVLPHSAMAGTAFVDFSSGVGPLYVKVGGSGVLSVDDGRGSFSGPNVTVIGESGLATACGGSLSTTMMLQPSTDAVNGVGLIIMDASDPQTAVTAIVYGDGSVVLTDWIGNMQVLEFHYPGAYNNSLTLTYDSTTERATMMLNTDHSAFLELALNGATSVSIGVIAEGPGGFKNFTGQGPCIPDYPSLEVDTDEDGVSDADEATYGSDPNDPGHLPVFKAQGATIHSWNGVTALISSGSLPQNVVVIKVSTPGVIPVGAIPDGKRATTVAVSMEPAGTVFSTPVQVTLPYTPAAILGMLETNLTVFVYDGVQYTADGIAGVVVDAPNNRISFTTSHFSTFLLAGDALDSDGDGTADIDDAFPHNAFGATDSDGDGIGDEWEEQWFGNHDGTVEPDELVVANASSDSDGDNVPDRIEFEYASQGANPTDGTTVLPLSGVSLVSLVLLGSLGLLRIAGRGVLRG